MVSNFSFINTNRMNGKCTLKFSNQSFFINKHFSSLKFILFVYISNEYFKNVLLKQSLKLNQPRPFNLKPFIHFYIWIGVANPSSHDFVVGSTQRSPIFSIYNTLCCHRNSWRIFCFHVFTWNKYLSCVVRSKNTKILVSSWYIPIPKLLKMPKLPS